MRVRLLDRGGLGRARHANGLALTAARHAALDRRADAMRTVWALEAISPDFALS